MVDSMGRGEWGGGGRVVEERRIPSLCMSSSSEQVEARASN